MHVIYSLLGLHKYNMAASLCYSRVVLFGYNTNLGTCLTIGVYFFFLC